MRPHAGKSSVVNAITDQSTAIVSDIKGTTTDPVYKSMEILPLGPVVIIDTAGIDDQGELGKLRVSKTFDVLNKTDIALVVIDIHMGFSPEDERLVEAIIEKKRPFAFILNKVDSAIDYSELVKHLNNRYTVPVFPISTVTKEGIEELKNGLEHLSPEALHIERLVADLLAPNDMVLLVTPIDSAAPKGRLILPQQQVLRDVLDSHALALVVKEDGLKQALDALKQPPKLVITDSQVFDQVNRELPSTIPLTSFSILFARYKGDLLALIEGARSINALQEGAKILVAEGCTHHRQEDDIGTVKIPKWLNELTGKSFHYTHVAGATFTEDVQAYDLIIHCGACMLNPQAMKHRIELAKVYGVPIVNYGIMIAYVHDMMERVLEPFPLALALWNE